MKSQTVNKTRRLILVINDRPIGKQQTSKRTKRTKRTKRSVNKTAKRYNINLNRRRQRSKNRRRRRSVRK
jgi:hypothetical protein